MKTHINGNGRGSMLPWIFCLLLWVPSSGLSLAGETPDPQEARAREYAAEFTSRFVAESCWPKRCNFIPDEGASAISMKNGKVEVSIHGRREALSSWQREVRKVSAHLTLKPVENDPELPYGFVVLDFSFTEGAAIPIPSK